jgi:hypothetical protein
VLPLQLIIIIIIIIINGARSGGTHLYNDNYSGGRGRMDVQGRVTGKSPRPYQKQTKAKSSRSIAQVVDCLSSKYQALNSIPSIT